MDFIGYTPLQLKIIEKRFGWRISLRTSVPGFGVGVETETDFGDEVWRRTLAMDCGDGLRWQTVATKLFDGPRNPQRLRGTPETLPEEKYQG
jgi:hypothetical protein